jgi:hypothetical protein
MSSKYVIKWKSNVNGRAGRGTKEFEREEAERLVEELNAEYPDIEHEAIPAPPSTRPSPEPPHHEPEPSTLFSEPSSDHSIHALSFR